MYFLSFRYTQCIDMQRTQFLGTLKRCLSILLFVSVCLDFVSIFGIADTFCFRLSRCRVYSGLPSYCTLVADPADSCCRVPKCQSGPINYQPIYNNMVGSSTPAPNAFNVVPIGSHNTIYGSNEIKPGSNNPFTASGGQSNHSSTIIMLLWRFLKKISIII